MAEINTILAGHDLTEHGSRALERAGLLAKSLNARLVAVHVIKETPLWWFIKGENLDPDEVRHNLRFEAIAAIETDADKLTNKPDQPIEAATTSGLSPYKALIRDAKAKRADMIVLGAHSGRHLADYLVGTTAERVASRAELPVLVNKAVVSGPYQRVFVAIDFSNTSLDALKLAKQVAPNAEFILMHAHETWFETTIGQSGASISAYEQLKEEEQQRLEQKLYKFAQQANLSEDQFRVEVVLGYPGTAVLERIKAANPDLVACGNDGLGGVEHLLLGSVAQTILIHAPADVLIAQREQR